MQQAVCSAFKEVDAAMARRHSLYVTAADEFGDPGTTATTLLVNETQLVFSNLGDSRAILCRGGVEVLSTTDHKPNNAGETSRIEGAGGWVVSGRVCRMLAVARALGDHTFKGNPDLLPEEQMLSPIPDVIVFPRSDEDEFALLACDGVFDVMSNLEVVEHIKGQLLQSGSLSSVCNSLTQECYKRGSQDNITAVLVCFEGAKRGDAGEDGQLAAPRTVVSARTPSWISRAFGAPVDAGGGTLTMQTQMIAVHSLPHPL
jgi:serine/threonine protein phosphatase PrpC